ncbi:MAG TPA: 50S ribosomal protein L21 [Candidatus Limnocylindrales bacterium]|nr:50S ribosomal protein L21 [Candidatus Limnocylindrales bacterium]
MIDYEIAPGGVFSMFAIIAASGKQFRVQEGDRIVVDQIRREVGETVRLDSVLLVSGEAQPLVGTPFVSGATVDATVLGHRVGDKVVVFKYKAKSRYRRKYGHRATLTELKIATIHRPGDSRSSDESSSSPAPVGAPAPERAGRPARRGPQKKKE